MVEASTKFLYASQLNLLFISCFINLVLYIRSFHHFLEVNFVYNKLYIFKVYNLMCLEKFTVYIYW